MIHLQACINTARPGAIPAQVDAVGGDIGAAQIGIHPAIFVGVVATGGLGVAQAEQIHIGGGPGGAEFNTVDGGFFALHRVNTVGIALQALAKIRVRGVVTDLCANVAGLKFHAKFGTFGQHRF